MDDKELHEQRIKAVGERVGVFLQELQRSFNNQIKAEQLKPQPKHPQMIFMDWVMQELAVILFNQEQLTNNWNIYLSKAKGKEQ